MSALHYLKPRFWGFYKIKRNMLSHASLYIYLYIYFYIYISAVTSALVSSGQYFLNTTVNIFAVR